MPVTAGFLRELATWWWTKCLTVENCKTEAKVRTVLKVENFSWCKMSDHEEEQQQQELPAAKETGVLSTLVNISSILEKGFGNMENQMSGLKKSVKTSNANMVALNANIDAAFKGLKEDLADSDSESDEGMSVASAEAGVEPGPSGLSGRAAGAHELSSSGEEESVLTSKGKEIELDDSVGPPLQDPVADFISKSCGKKWKQKELEKKKAAYPKPSNAECLSTPKINEAVFAKLGTQAKNRDRGWQNNHITFVSAVSAMSRVADVLMVHEKSAPWVKEALSLSADALNLCGALNSEWTKSRREDIKTYLPEDFKRLVSDENPASKNWLFGDDLEGSIKAVESHNRLAKKMETATPKEKPAAANFQGKRKFKKRKRRDFKPKDDGDNRDSYKKKNTSSKDFQKRGANR